MKCEENTEPYGKTSGSGGPSEVKRVKRQLARSRSPTPVHKNPELEADVTTPSWKGARNEHRRVIGVSKEECCSRVHKRLPQETHSLWFETDNLTLAPRESALQPLEREYKRRLR